VERRSAGEARRRAMKRRDRGRPAAGRCVLSSRHPRQTRGSRAGERARGERTSEGFLPPFFLFLGAILSGRWKCAGAATGAREWRRRMRKSSLHTTPPFFARAADSRREPQRRVGDREPSPRGSDRVPVLAVSRIGKCAKSYKSQSAVLLISEKKELLRHETSLTPRRATMFSDAWRASSRGFASAAKPLRKGAQPPASQPLVLLGVCVGLALAAAPLAFKSVRQREQSVAEMRDAQYAGDGKDAARDDRLKGRPNKSR